MIQTKRVQLPELGVNFYIYRDVTNSSFVEYKEIFDSNILSGNLLGNIFADMEHLRDSNFPTTPPSYCPVHDFLYALAGDSNKSDLVAKAVVDTLSK